MCAAVRKLVQHPFKGGDVLVLSTRQLPSVVDNETSKCRLRRHLDELFLRVNKVHPDGATLQIQKMAWKKIKCEGEGKAGRLYEVRPFDGGKKRRRELEETETSKRVRRKVIKDKGANTADVDKEGGAFYIKYSEVNGSKVYKKAEHSAMPFRLKDLRRRFNNNTKNKKMAKRKPPPAPACLLK